MPLNRGEQVRLCRGRVAECWRKAVPRSSREAASKARISPAMDVLQRSRWSGATSLVALVVVACSCCAATVRTPEAPEPSENGEERRETIVVDGLSKDELWATKHVLPSLEADVQEISSRFRRSPTSRMVCALPGLETARRCQTVECDAFVENWLAVSFALAVAKEGRAAAVPTAMLEAMDKRSGCPAFALRVFRVLLVYDDADDWTSPPVVRAMEEGFVSGRWSVEAMEALGGFLAEQMLEGCSICEKALLAIASGSPLDAGACVAGWSYWQALSEKCEDVAMDKLEEPFGEPCRSALECTRQLFASDFYGEMSGTELWQAATDERLSCWLRVKWIEVAGEMEGEGVDDALLGLLGRQYWCAVGRDLGGETWSPCVALEALAERSSGAGRAVVDPRELEPLLHGDAPELVRRCLEEQLQRLKGLEQDD